MLSIICATNNKSILNDNLIKSLKGQNFIDYELIIVDTVKNNFKNASSALNYGASIAKGDYFIFCHQDIVFLDSDVLSCINDYICSINDFRNYWNCRFIK